jgi:hypothetical protein
METSFRGVRIDRRSNDLFRCSLAPIMHETRSQQVARS